MARTADASDADPLFPAPALSITARNELLWKRVTRSEAMFAASSKRFEEVARRFEMDMAKRQDKKLEHPDR